MTVTDALREAAARLAATSDTARLDAEVLMAHAMGKSRSDLLLRHLYDTPPRAFFAFVDRRAAHEPIAYITGQQEFFGLNFLINKDTLIPRGDSELLVETALAARPGARWVLDCGTGSGALLLAVLTHLPKAEGIGIDRSVKALGAADENVNRLGLLGRARLTSADWTVKGWTKRLRGRQFDLILANPPYVEDAADLAPSVRNYEPAGALFAGPEGLDAYRVLIPQFPALLAPGGAAFVEIGAAQADAVSKIAVSAGFVTQLHRDLGGRPRVLHLQIPLGKPPAAA